MPFELPPEIEALRRVVRDFANREIRPRVHDMERDERIPQDLVDQMGELGFFGPHFPEQWGGAGMGELGFVIVQEELSRAHASTGLLVAASSGLASAMRHWSDVSASLRSRRRRWMVRSDGRGVNLSFVNCSKICLASHWRPA